MLSEPYFSTEQDEQHPGYGEYRSDQQSGKDGVPGELPGFRLGHLVTLAYSARLTALASDAFVMPTHALHVHTADYPAIIVIILLWFVCH